MLFKRSLFILTQTDYARQVLDWQVPVYEGLRLVAVRLLGIVNVPPEVPPLQDAPVDLVQILQRREELRSLQVRVPIGEHSRHATLGQAPK